MFDDPSIADLRPAFREWVEAIREHHTHESFRSGDDVIARQFGFTCGCGAQERAWLISLSDFRRLPTSVQRDVEELRARFRAMAADLWEKATKRAQDLLDTLLDTEARRQLAEQDAFLVRAGDGRSFRIERGVSMNVVLVEGDVDVVRYCVHIADYVPTPDHMLAQKLLLESNPTEFYRMANHQWLTADEGLRTRAPRAGGRLIEVIQATPTT